MKTRQREIEEMLINEGWQIVQRERPSEWWLDEIWRLESGWSPIGEQAYVGFLVDPQAPAARTPGEHVWAVCVTRQHPVGPAGMANEVPLRPRWESVGRAEVTALIRGLRRRRTGDDE